MTDDNGSRPSCSLADGHILVWSPQYAQSQEVKFTEDDPQVMHRVLWTDDSDVVTIYIAGPEEYVPKTWMPVWISRNELDRLLADELVRIETEDDPYEYLAVIPEAYKEKHKAVQQRRWQAIENIVGQEPDVFKVKVRADLVKKASKKHECSPEAIIKWLKRYFCAGKDPLALFPDYDQCGAIPKDQDFKETKYPTKDKADLYKGLKAHHRKSRTLPEAQTRIDGESFAKEIEPCGRPVLDPARMFPTNLVRYYANRLKKEDVLRDLVRRVGDYTVRMLFRPLFKNSRTGVFGPRSVYQVDHTTADIYLVSRYDPDMIIGRPKIYLVMDCYSHMIVGVYATVRSWLWESGGSQALLQAFLPKNPFLEELGMHEVLRESLGKTFDDSIWPVEGLCNRVVADSEFINTKTESIVCPLGIIITRHPSGEPPYKGLVEKHQDLAQKNALKTAPGYIDKCRKILKRRSEQNYKYDAVLTLQDFLQLFLCWVFYWNNVHLMREYKRDLSMIREHVAPNPREILLHGNRHRSGLPRVRSRARLELELLPRALGVIERDGLDFRGIRYIPQMDGLHDLIAQASLSGSIEVPVTFDSLRPEIVYMHWPEGQGAVPCFLNADLDGRYRGFYLDEIESLMEVEKKALDANEMNNRQALVDKQHVIDHVVEKRKEIKKRHAGVRKTRKARGDVDANRSNEIARGETGGDVTPAPQAVSENRGQGADESVGGGLLDYLFGERFRDGDKDH